MDHGQLDTPATLRAVGTTFRRQCRGRRVHPTTLYVGVLRGSHTVVPQEQAHDRGLRVDLLERILGDLDVAAACLWVTRGGALSPGDDDLAWFAAASAAFGRHGHRLTAFYLITRDGWLDLATDATALWRPRSA